MDNNNNNFNPNHNNQNFNNNQTHNKKINKQTVFFDWDEFKNIYNKLYSKDEKEQRLGIKRIAAWKSRNKLPISIEVTSYFVELLLLKDKRSQAELELGLSMAITRMVNGFIDSTRDMLRIHNKFNMFKKANELNLPTMFVDIRHDASHGKLPSLNLLSPVSKTALQWLDDNYWQPQLSNLEFSYDIIRSFLDNYKSFFENINNQSQSLQNNNNNNNNQFINNSLFKFIQDSQIINQLSSDILGNIMIPILLDDNYLITSEYNNNNNNSSGNNSIIFSHIPSQLKKLYTPLLQFLHSLFPHFLNLVLFLLLHRICKFSPLSKKQQQKQKKENIKEIHDSTSEPQLSETKISLMTQWILYFLDQFQVSSVEEQEGLVNYKIELPYRFMLEKCLENINSKYCQKILNVIMKKKNIDTSNNNSSRNNNENDNSSGNNDEVNYSADQVLSTLNQNGSNDNSNNNNNISNNQVWKIQKEWRSCPIGVLPPPNDQTSSSFDLPDDLDDNLDLGNFVQASSPEFTTFDPSLSNSGLFISKLNSMYPNLNKNSIIRKDFINLFSTSTNSTSESNADNNSNTNNIDNNNSKIDITESEVIIIEDHDNNEQPLKKQKIIATPTKNSKKSKSKKDVLNDFMFWK